ncbi:two component transcriptional regulator, winged helix family [Catenulispora acidiphila DSM 44928]|uniref:Two component transcriptional regulator, winged helix family n=1 Tax=Catenulispora acidiphila (strain DSM 44928 / JCM 14897 / NBRC 102108 / NRRL B-24433 / ID139908) TaxID=479433 RepID=C7Q0B2_CATAD|nr:response regulator transcription factor [Catenulispora acidiphila]ACU77445.1 two component transcriptional regulator, winged helix family [Catenulispora acidiphila DSM 44928]
MRVLIAEDEPALAALLAKGLRRRAMAVDVALDGGEALERLAVDDYDVLVLDRDLPEVHGDEVCRRLAAGRARVRILMLTAAAAPTERVAGLNLGADDYLPKPFDYDELVARVLALGRRAQAPLPPVLERAGIRLDSGRRQAFRDGTYLPLSLKEFGILEALLAADGTVVSSERLLESVWDANADPFTNTVRVTLSKLRSKLGKPDVVETVIGSGYRIS